MRFSGLFSLFCGLTLFCTNLLATEQDTLEIYRFSSEEKDTASPGLQLLIKNELEYQLPGVGFKVQLMDQEYHKDQILSPSRMALGGEISKDLTEKKTLNFFLLDHKTGRNINKSVLIADLEPEQVAQIVALKVRDYLEGAFFGKLNVSSFPIGSDIILDGNLAGATPKELTLRTGGYSLRIEGDYLVPWESKISLEAGKTMDIQANLIFQGFPTKYWLWGATAFSVFTGISWFLENQYHQEYLALPELTSRSDFDLSFKQYQNMNYVRLGLLNGAVIGWIGTGFCYYTNKALKKRIFKSIPLNPKPFSATNR